MAHRLSHIIPIYGPYMSHTNQFGKAGVVNDDINNPVDAPHLFMHKMQGWMNLMKEFITQLLETNTKLKLKIALLELTLPN